MELTPEYIKAVRFTVKRGNTYDAAEVDAFLDELLEAVTALQNTSGCRYPCSGVYHTRRDDGADHPRSTRSRKAHCTPAFGRKCGLAADFFGFYAVFVHKYLTRERDML